MATARGLFDPLLVPAGWFDDTALVKGWFDKDLLDVASGGFPAQISGLRYHHGTMKELCLVAWGDAPAGNRLAVSKNGTTYAAYLVATSDPNASPVRVQTSAGVMAIRYKTGAAMPLWTYLNSDFHESMASPTDTYSINVGTITDDCFLAVGYFISENVTEAYTSITLDGVATLNAVTHTEAFVHMGVSTWELTAANSGQTKSLVFTWPNNIVHSSISFGLVGAGVSRTATGTDQFAYGPSGGLTFFDGSSGNGTGTQSIPSSGIGLAVAAHNTPGTPVTWTGATEDSDFAVTTGGWRKTMAHLTVDADPNVAASGPQFVGVMAAFGP